MSALNEQVATYLATQRWFGGKGRDFVVTEIVRLGELRTLQPSVSLDLATVEYVDGDLEHYHLPIAAYSAEQPRLGPALVSVEPADAQPARWNYDAVHDATAVAALVAAFADPPAGPLTFHAEPGAPLDTLTDPSAGPSRLFTGEQSNSSISLADQALLKIFRKVSPGLNPDIEIHRALTRAAAPNQDPTTPAPTPPVPPTAALFGWIQSPRPATSSPPSDHPPATSSHPQPGPENSTAIWQLGMLQEFLAGALDGWDLALASAGRNDDFTAEATLLGQTVATIHQVLATVFPTPTLDAASVSRRMTQRLLETIEDFPDLPELDGLRPGLTALFGAIGAAGAIQAQRVHSDLHLGQTLRVPYGWKLVDFEGEPAKPLEERVLPDSPLRDVAGMLRSFDYAAASAAPVEHAATWSVRNQEAFLRGYIGGRTMTPDEQSLLAAYVADKAVYEVRYEARNRPTWTHIPLAALHRIVGGNQ